MKDICVKLNATNSTEIRNPLRSHPLKNALPAHPDLAIVSNICVKEKVYNVSLMKGCLYFIWNTGCPKTLTPFCSLILTQIVSSFNVRTDFNENQLGWWIGRAGDNDNLLLKLAITFTWLDTWWFFPTGLCEWTSLYHPSSYRPKAT